MSSALDVAKLIAATELDFDDLPAYASTYASSPPAPPSAGAVDKLKGSRIDATLIIHEKKVSKEVMDDVNNWTLWARRAANAHIKKNPGKPLKEWYDYFHSRLVIAGVNIIQEDEGEFRDMSVSSTVEQLVLDDIKTVSPDQIDSLKKLLGLYADENHKTRWNLFNDYAKLGDSKKKHFNLGANTVDEFDSAIFSGGYYQFEMGSTEIDHWLWSTQMTHIDFAMGRSVYKLTKSQANSHRAAILKALGDSTKRIETEELD